MKSIGPVSAFIHKEIHEIDIGGLDLLLIYTNDQFYLIENKCGHFGVPLSEGKVDGEEITCAAHGFRFDLKSGVVIDRPYENCDPVRVFPVTVKDGHLFVSTQP